MAVATNAVAVTAIGLLLYTLYGVFYRLLLSPIAKFPGPRLAALTFWYEFYYDVVKKGAFYYEIERMHEQYGPIVRINPYEIHVRNNNLDWMNRLYPAVGKEVDKFWWLAGLFGNTEMAFGTIPHHVHKLRRGAFAKFFSPAAIQRVEPAAQDLIDSMCTHIEDDLRKGKAINLAYAYSALTSDIINEYCFARTRGLVEAENFSPDSYRGIQSHLALTPMIKHFPWLIPTLNRLPDWWVRATNPMAWDFRLQERGYAQQVARILEEKEQSDHSHPTVFHDLKNAPQLPDAEKTQARLVREASSLVGAGTVTTAHMLALTTFCILNDNTILQRAINELKGIMPDRNERPRLSELEKLPYLTALVNEGLRLSYGATGRLARVHHEPLVFQNWVVPPNTAIGMTPYILNTDREIFPEPEKFVPDRWLLDDPKDCEQLARYLLNFGKGSRQCVGMRLAYTEMYLALATIIRRFGDRMQLFETEYARDIEYVHDCFLPTPRAGSRGLRVVSVE